MVRPEIRIANQAAKGAIDTRVEESEVRRQFAGCTYPELKLAMRSMREMMEEIGPTLERKQMLEFEAAHPELTIRF